MDSRVLTLAERVIGRSDSAHPADAVLRAELKSQRDLSAAAATATSRLVFRYFRWRGWLDLAQPLPRQLAAAAELAERFQAQPASFSGAELVARSVPAWIGQEIRGTPDWARSLQAEPRMWLRARPGQGSSLAKRLGNCRIFGHGPLGDILEYAGCQDLFRTPEFHAGEFEVQDLSSQAVGLACAPKAGQTWWDACAGEGGKLLHLSDLMSNQGLIWATDRAAWRLQRLKRRAARAKAFNYRSALWNGGAKLPTKTKFDGVLVDAPCSGTGTWQRNPHARWTLTPQDVAELARLQLEVLGHAATAVNSGGKLVYAVCSLTQTETAQVTEDFARSFPEFAPLPMADPLEPRTEPQPQLFLRPQQFGGNGMFIAAWTRRQA